MRKKSSRIFSLFAALLILGISNHCAFENLFAYLMNVNFEVEARQHLDNHLGSDARHTHSEHSHSTTTHTDTNHHDSSEQHQHGLPHPLLILGASKVSLTEFTAVAPAAPYALLFIFMLVFSQRILVCGISPSHSDKPPNKLHSFIESLTSAPQAPPLVA